MNNPFSAITTAGLLLPLDLLTRVNSMDRSLPGMSPSDYHVSGAIRLNEAATSAYSRALASWKTFRKKFAALLASDTGTTLTRDEWLLPLFECLGYGRLQTKRAISIDGKDYPISHGWEEHVPIHLLSARLPLDKRTQNTTGAASRSPYSLVQELINRSPKHRWGFVSNGLKFYVLRDNASLTRSANVEFDLETMMDGEYHADFTVLFLICHQSRLEIHPHPIVTSKGAGKKSPKPTKPKHAESEVCEKSAKYLLDLDDEEFESSVAGVARLQSDLDESELNEMEVDSIEEPARLGPENCWLEAWTKVAGEQGTRAKEKLRIGVQLAIQTLGAGFYSGVNNTELHQRLRSGKLSTQDYYRQLLRLVYRLLMIMVAEEKRTESGRNLLHPIDTPAHIRDRYTQYYSIGRIRRLANERRGTPHRDLYEGLKTTFLKLREGYAPLGIPGIGSFLFSDSATPDLDDAQITNEALLDAFRNLCFTEDTTGRGGSVRRAVDFGNLGSEELGSIYESLLELHPEIDSQEGPFVLRTAAGNERKTSGSYYTPTSLINCLLDSALDPVVNKAIDVPNHEEAKRRLLDLKVCDPACGSGHFLIAAANRMALHLARLETQDTEPTTLQIQHAKRQIIGRCIYGVDINEMAVELCKVSLWMEALEPGKPFSFLENHIKCGNSLLGATPRLLNEGIPDEAFNPIEGDNKEICSQLKKQNKRERIDHKSGQQSLFAPVYKLGNIADRFSKLSSADDETLESVALKQKEYEELVKGSSYLYARFWADTWCAAFVWKKEDTDLGRLCPTERKLREIEDSPHAASAFIRDEVQRLANQYQFFHWHLAFPDVFRLPNDEAVENEQTGWSRGFDVVLGNPPWEKMQTEEAQFFASKAPEIATLSGSKRKRAIALLSESDPELSRQWNDHKRFDGASIAFIRNAGVFPLTGKGKFNSSALFAETNQKLIRENGSVGCIVPTGIATDDVTSDFFRFLIDSGTLASLYDFENRLGLFDGVDRRFRFCLLTIERRGSRVDFAAEYAFFIHSVDQLLDAHRRFSLSPQDIAAINPNSRTSPLFRNRSDAILTKLIHETVPALVRETIPPANPWRTSMHRMLNMTDDSHLFKSQEQLSSEGLVVTRDGVWISPDQVYVRLFEAKMIHQFDHRWSMRAAESSFDSSSESLTTTRFHTPKNIVTEYAYNHDWKANWFIGWRDITNTTNERTVIASVIPWTAIGNTIYLLFPAGPTPSQQACLIANLSSFTVDYAARQKLGGTHLTFTYMRQLPIFGPDVYGLATEWHKLPLLIWVLHRALELTFTACDLEGFASDCGYDGPSFLWTEERRFRIRCELDAAYFHLYLGSPSEWGMANGNDKSEGVNETLLEMFATPRDAVSYIMDTFPIVRRKDEAKHGDYRTKRVILEIYDQMTEIIEANEAIRQSNPGKSEEGFRPLLRSYQSPLNPPPGPPADANGNFIPFAEWTDEIRLSYRDVIHIDSVSPNQTGEDRAREDQRKNQGQGILYLRLILKERKVPIQFEALACDLCFVLNTDLRRRFLLDETLSDNERAIESPISMLPSLLNHLKALQKNGIIDVELRGIRQMVRLIDESDLDTPLCIAMSAQVQEAIKATAKLHGKRLDDAFAADSFEDLLPYLKEGELENLTAL